MSWKINSQAFIWLWIIGSFNVASAQDSFEDFEALIDKQFQTESERIDGIYDAVNEAIDNAFAGLTKKIEVNWPDGALPTKSKWVTYSDDMTMRANVDFEKGEMSVEIIIDDDSLLPQKAIQLAEYATELIQTDGQGLDEKDSFLKELEPKLPSDQRDIARSSKSDINPLSKVVNAEALPTQEDIKNETENALVKQVSIESLSEEKSDTNNSSIVPAPPSPDSEDEHVQKKETVSVAETEGVKTLKITIPFVNDYHKALIDEYEKDITSFSTSFDIPVSIILAIIETESSFNPRAVSAVPAFGLMQLVPKTAGVDAYNLVYGSKKVVTPDYLFDQRNNLELGAAYFHILTSRYLKRIDNDLSRFYCAVASYNTGVGNLARTFTGTKSISAAVEKINTMSPEQVYDYLINNLAATETKNYLKKIVSRREKYVTYDL